MRLANKVALITGGGSGIGLATSRLFAKEGAQVVVSDINLKTARETVHSIRSQGGEAIQVIGDVSINEDSECMVSAAVDTYGRIDILVNSAGVGVKNAMPEEASPREIWDRVMDVNLKGTYLMALHSVPAMKLSGGGSIVNIASILGIVGYTPGPTSGGGFNPYAPSKAGVVEFTRNLGVACAEDNIRVNCLCPGFLNTRMTDHLTTEPETIAALKDLHPMGRLGNPEEIAYAALFLASDEASFITGFPLVVDGGYTAR